MKDYSVSTNVSPPQVLLKDENGLLLMIPTIQQPVKLMCIITCKLVIVPHE